jgi:hypothetical protein
LKGPDPFNTPSWRLKTQTKTSETPEVFVWRELVFAINEVFLSNAVFFF